MTPGDQIDELEAEVQVMAAARAPLGLGLKTLSALVPGADQVLVAVIIEGQLVVGSSDRHAFAEPMARWAERTQKEGDR